LDIELGRGKRARRAYGFDEVALVPGKVTINPDEIDIKLSIGEVELPIPILAAAMDGVVDSHFAVEMGKLGGLAVLNLDGINCRYDDVAAVYEFLQRLESVVVGAGATSGLVAVPGPVPGD